MAKPPKFRADVTVSIRPGYNSAGRFAATFSASPSGIVDRRGNINLTGFTGPVFITFVLDNPDPEPRLWWSFLNRGQFHIFSYVDDEAGELRLIDDAHPRIRIHRAVRGGQTVEIEYSNFAGVKRTPPNSRYNIYLTRGSEPNIVYVVDPIIRNGQRSL